MGLEISGVTFSGGTSIAFEPPPYTIQYLIVAGGGSGGYAGGGGGGFRTGNISVTSGTTYPITAGYAGNGGSNGFNSIAFGVTALGGGFGGQSGAPTPGCGNIGGSGGGGFRNFPGLFPRSGAPGTAGQGNPGGSGLGTCLGQAGGGGGGAGGPGGNAVMPAPNFGVGGNAGSGQSWPYTGPTTFYAAGGAGAGGGTGGGSGGAGQPSVYGKGGNGCGGGCRPSGQAGVVILAVPTPNYPGSAPGATVTTPPAAPGYTVLTYIGGSPPTPAPGTYIYTA